MSSARCSRPKALDTQRATPASCRRAGRAFRYARSTAKINAHRPLLAGRGSKPTPGKRRCKQQPCAAPMKGRASGKRRYGYGSADPIKGDIPDIFNTRRPGAGSRSHFTAATSTAARRASSRSLALLQHALLRRRLALALHRLHRRPHLLRLPRGQLHRQRRR